MRARRPSETGEPESLLVRWSRRKRQAHPDAEERGETAPAAPAPAAPQPPPAAPSQEDAAPLGDADMPPLESLGPESDYRGFMSPGVSEELRRLALRKLFHSPLFNITDGLDDYDDDFTSFEVLREAFHAKHRRSAAPDSDPSQAPDYESAAESDSVRAPHQPSAEAAPPADADSASRPAGASEGEEPGREGAEAASEWHAEAVDVQGEASRRAPRAGEGAALPREPKAEDAGDVPVAPFDPPAPRLPFAGQAPEEERAAAASGDGDRIDEAAPADGDRPSGEAGATDAPGRGAGEDPAHG